MVLRKAKKVIKLPPEVIALKLKDKTHNKARKIKARLFDTFPSDKQFYSALNLSEKGESLVSYFQKRKEPQFFISHKEKDSVVAMLREKYAESVEKTIKTADEVCNHRFNLLGSGVTFLGEEIDWQSDFKTGIGWEPKYYTDVNYVDLRDVSDIKVPWELSRFQHFVTLGKAYWYTKDEKYTREFCHQLADWVTKNPPQYGVNWTCTMDVAIRVVNWIWGYYFFADSPSFSKDTQLMFFKSLLAHGRHIANNLEYGEVNGNHYLSDIVGQIYLGIMFPEFKESKEWLDKGMKELAGEMEQQVYSDGVDFEASIGYHRLVLELFSSAALLARLNSIPLPDRFMDRLEKMFEFVMYYTKPDGDAPIVGDADDGRLHILSEHTKENINDHRYLLSIGAVIFERGDFAKAAGKFFEEAYWLLGLKGIDQFDRIDFSNESESASIAFPEGGFYILREDDLYLICHCGDIGLRGKGGHGHCDQLSFELAVGDTSYIVDPGAFVYTASPSERNHFRGTAYHNIVEVDGEEQNRISEFKLFEMKNDSRARLLKWEINQSIETFIGQHIGYTRLARPVKHQRKITFNKQSRVWEIDDLLYGEGTHSFKWYFHFDVGIVVVKQGLTVQASGKNGRLQLSCCYPEGVEVLIEEGWISKSYGVKQKAQVIKYQMECKVPVEVKFRVEVDNETGV